MATNSIANNHTGTVTLTSGGSSYVLTRTVYDRVGRVIETISDNTAVTTMAYDGANRQILVSDPLDNTTSSQYDGNGNAIFVTRTDLCTITTPTTEVEQFTSAAFYDCLNRQVAIAMQGADGSFTNDFSQATNWNSLPQTLYTLTGYDSRGNRTTSNDPKGNSTIMEYDGASRAIETDQLLRQNGDGSQGPDANSSFQSGGRGVVRTQMLFDGNGRIFQMIDDRGNESLYTFDLLDRQLTIEFNDGSTRTNAYDTAGNVTTYTDENGSIFANTFDCLGRKIAVAITRATNVVGTTAQSSQYDGLSRPTQGLDTISGTSAENDMYFDSLGRILEDTQIYGGNTRYTTQGAWTSLVLTELTYPNVRKTTNAFDALYRHTTVGDSGRSTIASRQFYGPNRIAEVALANGLTYTNMNNARTNSAVQSPTPESPSWGNNSSDRLGYDGCGRMITKRYLASTLNGSYGYSNTTAAVGFTTVFDRASDKVYERHIHAEDRSHLYLPIDAAGNAAFGYDSLDRLRQYQRGVLSSTGGLGGNGGGSITTPITLPGTDQTRTYTLDGLGNWKNTAYALVGGGGSPTATAEIRNHNDVNQIARINTNGTPQAFSYDHGNNTDGRKGNGNLVNDGTRSYIYDALNRLIQVTRVSDSAVIAVYTYDVFGRRIRKVITNGGIPNNSALNGTTDYLYDDMQIIEERNGDNTPTKQYVWGTYIDELIQIRVVSGPTNYYLLSDLLYRAVALTDSSGNIVEAYDTDAYGNSICFSAAGTGDNWFADNATVATNPINSYVFTGRQYDLETEIYCYRSRYYSSTIGRFLNRDQIGYAGGLNLYEYVNSSVPRAVDPFGTCALDAILRPLLNHDLNVDIRLGLVSPGGFLTFISTPATGPGGMTCADVQVRIGVRANLLLMFAGDPRIAALMWALEKFAATFWDLRAGVSGKTRMCVTPPCDCCITNTKICGRLSTVVSAGIPLPVPLSSLVVILSLRGELGGELCYNFQTAKVSVDATADWTPDFTISGAPFGLGVGLKAGIRRIPWVREFVDYIAGSHQWSADLFEVPGVPKLSWKKC